MKIEEPFLALQTWFFEKYKIKPLNFYYEFISHSQTEQPRLEIVFETLSGTELYFNDPNRVNSIEIIFSKLISESYQYKSKDLFVIHSYFDREVIKETVSKISDDELELLKISLNTIEIWTIKITWAGLFPIIFFNTKEQETKFGKSDLQKIFLNDYYKLLTNYDEFGFIKFDELTVSFDNRQNFEDVYNGSWINYFHDN